MKALSDDITIKTQITMNMIRKAFYQDLCEFEQKLKNYRKLVKVIQREKR